MTADGGDDAVGYKRPPTKSQFKKGQSGNPKGRPKGAKNFHTELAQELNSTITVTENGKSRQLSKRRVIAKRLVNAGVNGDTKAIPILLNAERGGEEGEGSTAAIPVGAEDQMVMEEIVKRILAMHQPSEPSRDMDEDLNVEG